MRFSCPKNLRTTVGQLHVCRPASMLDTESSLRIDMCVDMYAGSGSLARATIQARLYGWGKDKNEEGRSWCAQDVCRYAHHACIDMCIRGSSRACWPGWLVRACRKQSFGLLRHERHREKTRMLPSENSYATRRSCQGLSCCRYAAIKAREHDKDAGARRECAQRT